MNSKQDEGDPVGSPLPGPAVERDRSSARSVRDSGLRRVRRMSNLSLGALVVGVGATTGALASTIPPANPGATAVVNRGVVAGAASGTSQQAPTVATPVATASASGVTTPVGGTPVAAASSATGVSGRATTTSSRDS